MPDLQEQTPKAPPPNGNLEELQELLLTAERNRLDKLEADRCRLDRLEAERGRLDQLEDDLNQLNDHLRSKVVDATAVANILPEAIDLRTKLDQQLHAQHLESSLKPVFGKIFVRGIKGSSLLIMDTISPKLLPAIRHAVLTALQGMVQSMNRTLEHSLSWQGMTWRWEALKTGKSFGEVVLSHTLRYQVERVFLFFREDGAYLGDVRRPGILPFELGHEDLVSSMFSAIKTAVQKFTQDEFRASEQVSMKEIKMDDGLTVLIEQGPKAVLAAVVRGLPPPSLRITMQYALDSIHMELNEALQNFRGDKKPFEAARPHLEACLLHEESDSSNEKGSARGGLSPALVVLLALIVGSLAWWGITSYFEQQRRTNFLDKASEKPGIHITSIEKANGRTIVHGLRDPLSEDPQKIAQEVGLSSEAIVFQFENYLSLESKLIEQRARTVLNPPESVHLSVSKETTVLSIAGTAPHAWIAKLAKLSSMIPGVTSIQHDELQDESRLRLDKLIREIEKRQFDFEAGSASPAAESKSALQELRQAIRESDMLAQQLGHRLRVDIHGNTSDEGSVEMNRRLALARAQGILSALNVEQFPATNFRSVAESVELSAIAEIQSSGLLRERRVSFHVTVIDSGSRGSMP